MDPTDIARWQFAITTVYHFLFVPISIGLSAIIAGYQTAWLRTRNEQWLRLTKFFGKLFLINFAIGVNNLSGNSMSLLSLNFFCQYWQYRRRSSSLGSLKKYFRSKRLGRFASPGSSRSRWFVLPTIKIPSFSPRPSTAFRKNERTASVTRLSRSSKTK